jgi:isocitrate dehydrogenase kinase/phosphatase
VPSRLTDARLAELRALSAVRDVLPREAVRELLAELDATRRELALLKAEHADSDYWRKAFERLRDQDARDQRDRLDRVSARALGVGG